MQQRNLTGKLANSFLMRPFKVNPKYGKVLASEDEGKGQRLGFASFRTLGSRTESQTQLDFKKAVKEAVLVLIKGKFKALN